MEIDLQEKSSVIMLGKGGQPFPPTSPDNNHSGEVAAKPTTLRKP